MTAADLPKSIGWIGLGLMGIPMATNLVRKTEKDTKFYVFDVVKDSVEKFLELEEGKGRIEACASSKEVADKSDVIFSMVPEGSHVRSVYLTEDTGVLASDVGSKILIDCSTIDTGTSLTVRDACAEKHPKARFYDAPVSGGVIGAEKATLTMMLGCKPDDENIELLTNLCNLMGGNIFPCGGASLGLTAKLCNNYCSGLIAIVVSEAMNIGMSSGMDPRVLANIFHTSTAQTSCLDDWSPVPGLCTDVPSSKGYKGGFRVGLMRKDVGLAIDSAKRVGAKLALGDAGWNCYDAASKDEKCKNLDSKIVYRYLGGKEDWQQDFPEEVELRKYTTKKALQRGKEELKKKEAAKSKD